MRRAATLVGVVAAVGLLAPAAGAVVKWFHSPSGNIQCEVAAADPRGTYAYCQTFKPLRSVKLRANGAIKICRGCSCVGNGPPEAFTLGYGRSTTVGPFRCTSLASGMRCVVTRTGRGFLISRQVLKRI